MTIAFDERARKVLMIILKNGGVVYAKCTDANIAYLKSIGLTPSQIPPSIKVALKP